VVSHVRQARPLRERIEVWRSAVETSISNQPVERRFDLFDDGALVPWEETSPSVWSRKPSAASRLIRRVFWVGP